MDDYPVQHRGGSVRVNSFSDGSISVDADDAWDVTSKWLRITPLSFTGLLEDARKVMREGRIYCVAEVTVVYTAGTDLHLSTTIATYGPAWECAFIRKEVRHQDGHLRAPVRRAYPSGDPGPAPRAIRRRRRLPHDLVGGRRRRSHPGTHRGRV